MGSRVGTVCTSVYFVSSIKELLGTRCRRASDGDFFAQCLTIPRYIKFISERNHVEVGE